MYKEQTNALHVEDVLKIRPDLTEDQAEEVIENIATNCPDTGTCRDTLDFWSNTMFPKSKTWGEFTVEITETLQLRVNVTANSFDDAVVMVERLYQAGFHILGAEHCVGVEFTDANNSDPAQERGETYE